MELDRGKPPGSGMDFMAKLFSPATGHRLAQDTISSTRGPAERGTATAEATSAVLGRGICGIWARKKPGSRPQISENVRKNKQKQVNTSSLK